MNRNLCHPAAHTSQQDECFLAEERFFILNILTITLHPAIDKALKLRRLRPNDTARSVIEMVYGGGKGNNVARALTRLGVPVIASGFQGGYTGEYITRALNAEGIRTHFVACQQPTRTSLLIHEEETSFTYAIYEPGQEVSVEEIAALESTFASLLETTSLCLFCGSGQTPQLAQVLPRLITQAAERGVPSGVDSSGASLAASIGAKPHILKVNREELEEVSQSRLDSRDAQIRAMQFMHTQGIRLVALTLGEEGFLLSDGKETWHGVLPMEGVVNTVGCGDSLLAGVARGFVQGAALEEMLRWGVACGAANTQAQGAGFIDAALVAKLLRRVQVYRM